MNDLLAQMFFTARNRDVEGWMDMLVLVIVAVVYALGSIIKAKGKKQGEQPQQQPRKPARQPATSRKSILEQFVKEIQNFAQAKQEPARQSQPAVEPQLKKTTRSQATMRKYAVETKQASRAQTGKPLIKTDLSIPSPKIKPDFEEIPELGTSIQSLPEFTGKAVKGLAGKPESLAEEAVESKYLSEVISDYTDPDELKRAILHYEILGRPLSLRDPSGNVIGL